MFGKFFGRAFPWLILVAFVGFIYAMNVTYSFCSDDCYYGIAATDNTPPRSESQAVIEPPVRLDSFSAVWVENIRDGYRPVVHFFARLFTGWLGKVAFNVANTAMMGALLFLLFRLARGTWRLEWRTFTVQAALVLLVLCKGESYLWCAGSVNYLWAGAATLAFCLMRERVEQGKVGVKTVMLMVPAALLCGWAQEAFALPVCLALGLFALAHLRELCTRKVVVYGAYGVGAVLLILSAATRLDYGAPSSYSLASVLMNQIKIWVAAKGVWAVAMCLLFVRDRLGFLRRNAFELLVVLGSLLMISAVGFNGERSLWCANLFAIIVVVRTFTPPRWLAGGVLVASVPLAVALVSLGVRIRANFETFTNLYLASPEGVTCHERVPCGPLARFFHQAIYTWWQGDGHGRAFAGYHGRTTAPIALSRELYDDLFLRDAFCVPGNRLDIEGSFYTTSTANAIVMPLPEGDATDWATMRAQVTYDFPKGLKARIERELAARRDPPVPCGQSVQVLPTAHGRYLLIGKAAASAPYIREVRLEPR